MLPPPLLIRPMRSTDDNLPKLPTNKATSTTLSIRVQTKDKDGNISGDIPVVDGIVKPNTGGMSVNIPPRSNTPDFLNKLPCFEIDLEDLLIHGLNVRMISEVKGYVEPAQEMPYTELNAKIANTQKHWRKV